MNLLRRYRQIPPDLLVASIAGKGHILKCTFHATGPESVFIRQHFLRFVIICNCAGQSFPGVNLHSIH